MLRKTLISLAFIALASCSTQVAVASNVVAPVDPFANIMCDSDMECEEATGYPYDVALNPDPPKYPRLVGHGCKGAAGPIYAFEEDHLPRCREVVEMDWDWQERIQ